MEMINKDILISIKHCVYTVDYFIIVINLFSF